MRASVPALPQKFCCAWCVFRCTDAIPLHIVILRASAAPVILQLEGFDDLELGMQLGTATLGLSKFKQMHAVLSQMHDRQQALDQAPQPCDLIFNRDYKKLHAAVVAKILSKSGTRLGKDSAAYDAEPPTIQEFRQLLTEGWEEVTVQGACIL